MILHIKKISGNSMLELIVIITLFSIILITSLSYLFSLSETRNEIKIQIKIHRPKLVISEELISYILNTQKRLNCDTEKAIDIALDDINPKIGKILGKYELEYLDINKSQGNSIKKYFIYIRFIDTNNVYNLEVNREIFMKYHVNDIYNDK